MTENNLKRSFTPQDELRFFNIDAARFSPDGSKIVYSLRRIDVEKEKEFTHLWLLDLESGETRQLTRGEQN